MASTCPICKQEASADGANVRCHGCGSDLHHKCAGITESSYKSMGMNRKMAWKCSGCKADNKSGSSDKRNLSLSAGEQDLTAATILELKNIVLEMKNDLNESIKGQQFVSLEYEDMKKQILELVQEVKSMKNEVSDLLNKCAEKDEIILRQEERIQDLENHSRNRNIVLSGVIEKNGEKVEDIVCRVCEHLDVHIEKTDIEAAHRIPTQRPGVPKPIVVELRSRKIREEILRKKKQKEVFNDVIYSGEGGKVFIMEQVSPKIGYLKYRAKQLANRHNWKFVWIKNGKLFARKGENSPVVKIVTEENLEAIR
ncbi:uncharacterized protein LOC117645099 [Thrips palmi]|uniref:Uncharacterized protein LOC117645099 n=1 Tax=Thrips palmi TaxID=161013 RepID=A0A6P8Z2X7_THRPL|nr:uncharacterized protein LOC117645099 [Thrips palmi]